MEKITAPEGWSTIQSGHDIGPEDEVLAYVWSAWRYVYAVERRYRATTVVSFCLDPSVLGTRTQRVSVERVVVRIPRQPVGFAERARLAAQNARYILRQEARRKMKKSSPSSCATK